MDQILPAEPAPFGDGAPMVTAGARVLLAEIRDLIASVRSIGDARIAGWQGWIERPEFTSSAANLAYYLAFRGHDLRDLQPSLMALGLSSLGRLESRVMPTLDAVARALAAIDGDRISDNAPEADFFAGERRLAERTRDILGPAAAGRPVALLITCPSEAADDPAFMLGLATRGVEAIRINCAHDDADAWARMIGHARAAERTTGRRLKILMDIAGPKIRTGAVHVHDGASRICRDDRIAIVPSGGLERISLAEQRFAVECTLDTAISAARAGQRVFIDDGKLGAVVERVMSWGLLARVTTAGIKGVHLKSEKGINFPDTDLAIPALTEKDLRDLDFVAAHADLVGFSFVQSVADVEQLQAELAARRPQDWAKLALVLKIETQRAVRNLPDIIIRAAGRQPAAIMIARGDLAVEIGFSRMAEMQEEILWVGEAAQVPVIWATQVLERLIRKGVPSRGEMTDAAMAARAECVMLNKGPYLFDAIAQLDVLLGRMDEHQHKKTSRLRRLTSW